MVEPLGDWRKVSLVASGGAAGRGTSRHRTPTYEAISEPDSVQAGQIYDKASCLDVVSVNKACQSFWGLPYCRLPQIQAAHVPC